MVTMKLTDPSSDDVIRKIMPISHIVWPGAMSESGGYEVQPDCAAPPVMEEADEHRHAAAEVHPVAHHVELGEGHVGRADLQRHHEVAEAADGERHDAEEDHDRAVHRPELVVELGEHDAHRRAILPEPLADQRNRLARIGELPPHDHHQREAEEQEQQPGHGVLDADDFVVDRKDVLPPEPELLVMLVSVGVTGLSAPGGGHVVVQRLDSFKVMILRVTRGGLYAEGTSGCNLALGRKIDVMNRPRTATALVLAALAVGAAAVPAGANSESKALRAKASAQVYNLDRDDAMATFRQAIAADPDDAAAYRGLATTLWLSITFRRGNMTVDDYMGRVSPKSDGPPTPAPPETAAAFTEAVDKALAIARRHVAANPRDPDAHFELGAAVGLRASYVATVDGSAMGAFRSAREAYNEHEQVLTLAPARKDAGLIVGTYRYLVASLALPVRLMAYVVGFGGDKDRGLRMIEEAAAYAGDNEADARFALLLLYNREQRYDDALRELASLRTRFPRNRLALAGNRLDVAARRPRRRRRARAERGPDAIRRRSPSANVRRRRAVGLQAGGGARGAEPRRGRSGRFQARGGGRGAPVGARAVALRARQTCAKGRRSRARER